MNTLVRFLYSAKPGVLFMSLSVIGIPETKRMEPVMVKGPMMESHPHETDRARQ
jgi:hypothetical protein